MTTTAAGGASSSIIPRWSSSSAQTIHSRTTAPPSIAARGHSYSRRAAAGRGRLRLRTTARPRISSCCPAKWTATGLRRSCDASIRQRSLCSTAASAGFGLTIRSQRQRRLPYLVVYWRERTRRHARPSGGCGGCAAEAKRCSPFLVRRCRRNFPPACVLFHRLDVQRPTVRGYPGGRDRRCTPVDLDDDFI